VLIEHDEELLEEDELEELSLDDFLLASVELRLVFVGSSLGSSSRASPTAARLSVNPELD